MDGLLCGMDQLGPAVPGVRAAAEIALLLQRRHDTGNGGLVNAQILHQLLLAHGLMVYDVPQGLDLCRRQARLSSMALHIALRPAVDPPEALPNIIHHTIISVRKYTTSPVDMSTISRKKAAQRAAHAQRSAKISCRSRIT